MGRAGKVLRLVRVMRILRVFKVSPFNVPVCDADTANRDRGVYIIWRSLISAHSFVYDSISIVHSIEGSGCLIFASNQ